MTDVKVTVTLTVGDKSVSDAHTSTLTEDSVSILAGNLGFGLVEEAWGLVPDDA